MPTTMTTLLTRTRFLLPCRRMARSWSPLPLAAHLETLLAESIAWRERYPISTRRWASPENPEGVPGELAQIELWLPIQGKPSEIGWTTTGSRRRRA